MGDVDICLLACRSAGGYEGVTFEGDDNECAIGLSRVRSRHLGRWSCKVLAPRADRRPGMVVESVQFRVGEGGGARTSRLNSEEQIQGIEAGDDGTILTRFDVSDDERLVDVFWIVGR